MPRATDELSPNARSVLRDLGNDPLPRCEVNPGVSGKLIRLGLATEVQRPGNYKTVKRPVPHLQITTAGIALLAKSQ